MSNPSRRLLLPLLRYVLIEYVRSGTPLVEAGIALATAYLAYIGMDYRVIPATYFVEFATLLLAALGAVSATLLCRRAASARGLTVMAHLPGRSAYLLARLLAAAIVAVIALALSTVVLIAVFQRRVEPQGGVLLIGAVCGAVALGFAIVVAAVPSPLVTPHRYRVVLLAYVALLATAVVTPGNVARIALSPALLPALPLIGTLKLASQTAHDPLLVAATLATLLLDAGLAWLACRLFARRELLFE